MHVPQSADSSQRSARPTPSLRTIKPQVRRDGVWVDTFAMKVPGVRRTRLNDGINSGEGLMSEDAVPYAGVLVTTICRR